jgi:hypothetical protein
MGKSKSSKSKKFKGTTKLTSKSLNYLTMPLLAKRSALDKLSKLEDERKVSNSLLKIWEGRKDLFKDFIIKEKKNKEKNIGPLAK